MYKLFLSLALGSLATALGGEALKVQEVAKIDPLSIPESEYIVVRDGHLCFGGKGGQRQRFWGVVGSIHDTPVFADGDTPETRQKKIAEARKNTEALTQRLADLGFNAVRLQQTETATGDYTPGDGSPADTLDDFIAKLKKRGFKIWNSSFNRLGSVKPEDVGILDDPGTAEAWKAAVGEWKTEKEAALRRNLARAWDPRLQALGIQGMKEIATHYNKHTGLRWADDPVFAVWELSNEEWWMRRMLAGNWQTLPTFFRNQLIARWNQFLRTKYGETAALGKAWNGLLPGEDLLKESVLLAPMAGESEMKLSLNDASSVAAEALENLNQTYSRKDFAPQRGADVLEFFLALQIAHKQTEEAAVKSWGRSVALSPMIFDTGIGYEIQSQYLHQQADAIAHDAYLNGVGRDDEEAAEMPAHATDLQRRQKALQASRKKANAGPWINGLKKPPGISQGVPWLEHSKMEGVPFLCYETQIQQPAKYRADFPLRLVALASIQDWDFVCWHYFGPVKGAGTLQEPFGRAMDITIKGHPQGYHFTYDEVQGAMMRAAGHIFRSQLLAPAANPTRFVFGRKSLHDPATMTYGGSFGESGMHMLPTTYQYGMRLEVDSSREEDEIVGPVVKFEDYEKQNPYTPTGEMTFDWKKGFIRLDAPSAVVWAGGIAENGGKVAFANGVTLGDVAIINPEGIYDPVDEREKYLAFAMHSMDGKPLAETGHAFLSVVSTSFNTGFRLGEKGAAGPAALNVKGTEPVLVARVGATVELPMFTGATYRFLDWHMREIGSGTVQAGKLRIPAEKPVFAVELKR
jgi:hypothetical protein